MTDTPEALPPLPETFTINEAEEAFVRDFCPYKGSPDPLIVWKAAWASCSAALAQRQQVPEGWAIQMEGDTAKIVSPLDGPGFKTVAEHSLTHSDRLLFALAKALAAAPALSAAPSAQAEPSDDWQHLKQYGYAPGGYMSKCHRCGATPIMDKLAVTCRPCAETMHNEAKGL